MCLGLNVDIIEAGVQMGVISPWCICFPKSGLRQLPAAGVKQAVPQGGSKDKDQGAWLLWGPYCLYGPKVHLPYKPPLFMSLPLKLYPITLLIYCLFV